MTCYHWDAQSYHCPRILWSWKCSGGWDDSVGYGPQNKQEENLCAELDLPHSHRLPFGGGDEIPGASWLDWTELSSGEKSVNHWPPNAHIRFLPPAHQCKYTQNAEKPKKYLLLWLKKTHFSQYWGKVEEKQRKDLCEALKEWEKSGVESIFQEWRNCSDIKKKREFQKRKN